MRTTNHEKRPDRFGRIEHERVEKRRRTPGRRRQRFQQPRALFQRTNDGEPRQDVRAPASPEYALPQFGSETACRPNTPDWDTRLRILGACAEEIIADNEFGGGRPHWAILQALGRRIGLTDIEIEGATPLVSTRIAWLAWEALMSNRHWIEGLIANTCAERANVPGYGTGIIRAHGWFGLERHRWKQVFGLSDEELEFFGLHEEADIVHSNLGWQKAADQAALLHMEDQLVTACRTNLLVWESYLNGIADGGDALDRGEVPMAA